MSQNRQAPSGTAPIRRITPDEHTPLTTQTEGMERREILFLPGGAGGASHPEGAGRPGVWIGLTRTPPGSVSAWHHHGDYDTYIYVQAGTAHFDFGPGGGDACDAKAGDLLHVPRHAVHRETNGDGAENVLLIVRFGRGEPVFNVPVPAGQPAGAATS